MGLLDRLAGIFAARRTDEPKYPAASRIPFSGRALAGVLVTPDTAVTVSAVWACLRYLSQTVAVLPWHIMRETESGGKIADSHPLDWLIYKQPNPEWTSFQFRETLTHWGLRWGNGYAEIERDALGRPAALWPLHPQRVLPMRADDGRLIYKVSNETLSSGVEVSQVGGVTLEARDVFHIRGFGEGPIGVNVIHYAAESIGWARAAQLFGAAFFGNGMNVSGVVQNKRALKPEGMAKQRAEMQSLYKGPRNANKFAIIDADADFKEVGIEPEKAQFLGTNQFLVTEICRWFGVPPHKVAQLERSTNNNIEHQGIEAVVDSISPWAKRFEDEADVKLFGQNRGRLYTKMNFNSLMRGDSASRGTYFQLMRNIGAYNVNDIRRLDDLPTIGPDGDKYVMQSQYTTLDKIGEATPPPAAPKQPTDPAERAAQTLLRDMAEDMEREHVA